MLILELLAVFTVACVATASVIPSIRRIAVLRRLLDMPDGERRIHSKPIPRLGGVGVFFGFMVAVVAAAAWEYYSGRSDSRSVEHTAQMLVACAMLFGIGLADDIRGVSPVIKLAGQTAAALIVQYHWALLSSIVIPPNVTIHLGWLGVPIMVLWLVGVSNALNLVDGLDGLAGGVAVIGLLAAAAASAAVHITAPVDSVALIGALIGFLFFNWAPATIFLGDSGSLVIGFLLAFLTVRRSTTGAGTTLVIIPIFALAYPLLDTAVAMLRRWLRGHPLSRADGRHVHHQLRALGLSDAKVASLIYLHSAGVAALGLSIAFASPKVTIALAAIGAATLAPLFIYGARRLQYHEFLDAGAVLRSAGSLARSAIRNSIHAHDVAVLLSRATSLAEVDDILGAHAATFGFAHLQIGSSNAQLPVPGGGPRASYWKLEYPVDCTWPFGLESPRSLEDSLVLTVWCARRSSARVASAERVAQVVARAIADWSLTAAPPVRRDIRLRAATPAAGAPVLGDLRVSGSPYVGSGEHDANSSPIKALPQQLA